jgi:hypothetical protein
MPTTAAAIHFFHVSRGEMKAHTGHSNHVNANTIHIFAEKTSISNLKTSSHNTVTRPAWMSQPATSQSERDDASFIGKTILPFGRRNKRPSLCRGAVASANSAVVFL